MDGRVGPYFHFFPNCRKEGVQPAYFKTKTTVTLRFSGLYAVKRQRQGTYNGCRLGSCSTPLVMARSMADIVGCSRLPAAVASPAVMAVRKRRIRVRTRVRFARLTSAR